MVTNRRPVAEVFPPGDFIREELEARGWTQSELAEILGRPFQTVNQIVNGRKAITSRTARELEAALGPSAEFWMNLETSYQLHRENEPDPEITLRARERDSTTGTRSAGKACAPRPAAPAKAAVPPVAAKAAVPPAPATAARPSGKKLQPSRRKP